MILGADVGGTFTDIVLVAGGSIRTAKVPTTAVQSMGIATGANLVSDGGQIDVFLHGTTVATNALLERTGAVTALITDEGFEDIIEIGRQDRPSLYDMYADRAVPLVPRNLRFGGIDAWLATGGDSEVDVVAVVLVDGFRDPSGEERIRDAVRRSGHGGPISISSVVAPEFREYERTSTTVLNAYLVPVAERYLVDLEHTMREAAGVSHISVMRSSGGLMAPADAAALPAAILLSGPAGGATAAAAFSEAHGHRRVVSFDMGGTSTDVCRIEDGKFDVSYERTIGGFPCRLSSAAIHTVGAGGGSIAWIDEGGALRVGPHSAGADPGPACYGRGGVEPTVTDANIVLGRISPDAALGGSLVVDRRLAADAVSRLADGLGMTVEDAALGIIAVAEDVMGRAIRKVSIEEGADPRGAFLYAFGGAGGLHAVSLARSLGMTGVVVPPHGGVFSALGLCLAPPRSDLARSVFIEGANAVAIGSVAAELGTAAREELAAAGHKPVRTEHVVDVRYVGQAHEIGVPFTPGDDERTVIDRFTEAHERRNGFSRPSDLVEVVTVRCTVTGDPALRIEDVRAPARTLGQHRPTTSRQVLLPGGPMDARVVDRAGLVPGVTVSGPAIIEEDEATTFLGAGDRAVILQDGSIEVTW